MKPTVASLFGIMILSLILSASVAKSTTVCGTWNAAPTPNPSTQVNHFLGVAAVSASDVWAVGHYDADPDPIFELDQSLTVHWNGSSWSVVPSPNVGPSGTVLTGVAAVASNDVWAVGYSSTYGSPQTLALHWNGSSWSVIPSPVVQGGSGFESIKALSSTNIWAVGYRAGGLPDFTTTTGTMIAHWDGSSWTEVPSPNIGNRWNMLEAVATISANDVWAVGDWRHTGGNFQTLTEHWNGSSWTIVPSPNLSIENHLSAVAGVAGNDVWAIGGGWDGITSIPYFFHWSGSAWNQTFSPGGAGGGIITLASNDAWAVGGNIAHWDGATWSLVPNPTVPGTTWLSLNSVTAVSGCEAWAVGSATFATEAQTLAVRLTSGGGVINQPPVVNVSGTPSSGTAPLTVSLSSAGSFDPDGSIVSYLWNFGDSTYPPEQTTPNPVHTYIQGGPLTYHAVLTVTDDRGGTAMASVQIDILNQPPVAIASGTNTFGSSPLTVNLSSVGSHDPDGMVVSYHWDFGDGTSPPNQNDPNPVHTYTAAGALTRHAMLTVTDDHAATTSTGLPISINGGTAGVESGAAGSTRIVDVAPNPARSETGVVFELSRPGQATLRLFDLRGRLVATLAEGFMVEGRHVFSLGAGVPAMKQGGLYFLQLKSGGVTSSRKLVVLD